MGLVYMFLIMEAFIWENGLRVREMVGAFIIPADKYSGVNGVPEKRTEEGHIWQVNYESEGIYAKGREKTNMYTRTPQGYKRLEEIVIVVLALLVAVAD